MDVKFMQRMHCEPMKNDDLGGWATTGKPPETAPVLFTFATRLSDDAQVVALLAAFDGATVGVICTVRPAPTFMEVGDTVRPVTAIGVTVICDVPWEAA